MGQRMRFMKWHQPLYLEDDGRMRRVPRWDTVFVFLEGHEYQME